MPPSNTTPGEFDRREPIPGYKTVELLGRGGCGEVWKATAPGGLAKAVKIVFGDVDSANSTNATTEMRALTRIKDVRHPLLLSIERIEVSHGNLVIVTELADGSLKQRYAKLREAGSVGIPQDELLGYVADAAEALDYLYEKHSLQHLDVKPENILLVAERAKLGDFGLVKNLYERSVSIVGGLTPTYAPPELFEGKPSRHSDQYSLALVYMQMLTGVLPFAASNTAQLAAQHLRGIPDLSALPRRQGSVIARALSKDPAQRYESCKAMVHALRECLSQPDAAGSSGAQPAPQPSAETLTRTRPVESASISAPRTASIRPLETAVVERNIASRSPEPEAAVLRSAAAVGDCPPTLLVGIGGTGVEVLARFVDRLRDQYGQVEDWPAIEILVLDTNSRALSARFSNDVLERVRVVPIPLMSAESYGARAADYLKWLGRRWLYNIPRDLTTDGFRPLGRLALLTHAARVKQEIGEAVARIKAHSAVLDASGGANGAPLDVDPRVVLVGSICGGTASGSLIDAAYAIRSELKRRGLSDERVHGVLLHSTPRSNADRDKARASAYSMLSELFHYSRPGGFCPAEASLGITPFHGDNAAFCQTHILNLGDGLGQSEWEMAAEQAADFLYCTSCTPARGFLDPAPLAAPTSARTYDVLALGAGGARIVTQIAQQASADVLRLWREGRLTGTDQKPTASTDRTAVMSALAFVTPQRNDHSNEFVAKKLSECALGFEQFLDEAAEVVALESGVEPDEYLTKLIDEVLAATRSAYSGINRIEVMLGMVDRIMYRETDAAATSDASQSLYERIVARLMVRTRSRVDALMEWIRSLVDAPESRIEGARQNALAVRDTLQKLQNRILKQANESNETAISLGIEIRHLDSQKQEPSRFASWSFRREDPDSKLRPGFNAYGQKRLEEAMYRAAVKLIRIIDSEVATQIEQLDRLARDINLLAEPVAESSPKSSPPDDDPSGKIAIIARYQQELLRQLGLRRAEIAMKIESLIDKQLFQGRYGLRRFLDPASELRQTLSRPLAEISRRTVLDFIRQASVQLIENASDDPGRLNFMELIAAGFGTQTSAQSGSIAQRFLVVPETLDESKLRHRAAAVASAALDATIVRGRKSHVMLCSIGQETSLFEIGNSMIGGIDIYRDLASKLHTRSDIAWSPFVRTDRSAATSAAEPQATTATVKLDVMAHGLVRRE